jgi:hypothetical protein
MSLVYIPPMWRCPLWSTHLWETPELAARCCRQIDFFEPTPPSCIPCASGRHMWKYLCQAETCCNGYRLMLTPSFYGFDEWVDEAIDPTQYVLNHRLSVITLVPERRPDVIAALTLLIPFEKRANPAGITSRLCH